MSSSTSLEGGGEGETNKIKRRLVDLFLKVFTWLDRDSKTSWPELLLLQNSWGFKLDI